MTARAAIVGAGPSGFYAADQLLRAGVAVDVFDALPTPFGLVRAGVAPDHPKIKSVTRVFDRTAQHAGFRFFGGVELGADVTAQELLERYHAVVYAVGTPRGNRLGLPGEERPGSVGATEFVAWYNGHPRYADAAFDLSCTRAVVIGNGNVALDVARMLVVDPRELASTDAADHAIAALGAASITEVAVLGRRGPLDAAFTTPELRELGELAHVGRHRRPVGGRARSGRRGLPDRAPQPGHPARACGPTAERALASDRAALLPLAGRDPRRAGRRTGDRRACGAQPPRRRRRGAHRGARGDPLRPRDPLDRLPRPAARRAFPSTSAAG